MQKLVVRNLILATCRSHRGVGLIARTANERIAYKHIYKQLIIRPMGSIYPAAGAGHCGRGWSDERKVMRMPVLNTYLTAPVRLLLGTGPMGLHQVQLDD